MRIIAGTWRGRTLRTPRGREVRPTPDRVRESLFSILAEDAVRGRVLDLFAGTGALGLEALSRGAPSAVLVERSRDALRTIRANVEALGAGDRVRVLAASAFSLRPEGIVPPPFALVLADPPYDLLEREPSRGRLTDLLARLGGAGLLAGDGVVVLEHRRRTEPPEMAGLRLVDRRAYGDTGLAFYRP